MIYTFAATSILIVAAQKGLQLVKQDGVRPTRRLVDQIERFERSVGVRP